MADESGMSARIMFKPEVTPGNLVSWALIVGGFVYGYSTLNAKVDHFGEALAGIKSALGDLKATDSGLQTQINVIRDISTVRQIDISTKLTRLETILERQEGKLDARMTREDKLPIQVR